MTYASEVLADSPWAYWRQQETAGATLADATGNGRSLTLNGSAHTLNQAGPVALDGKAVAWANTTGHAITSATLATSTVTLEAWIYVTAYPSAGSGNPTILGFADSFGGATNDKELSLQWDGRLRLFCWTGSSQVIVTPTNAVPLNQWVHVVASVGAAGMKIRINKSTAASSANTTSQASAMSVLVRGGGNTYTDTFAVRIAEPAVYTTQLTDVRTDAHYDAAPVLPAAVTGTLSGTLPPLSANMSGGVTFSGTISAVLPPLGANLAGTSQPPGIAGDLTATLPPLAASLVGTYSDAATLAAVLPSLSANLAGSYVPPPATGTLDALLPALAANLVGQAFEPGVGGYLEALLPALSAAFSGDVLGRTGLGLALDSSAVLTVADALDPEPTVPAGTPPTVLHIIAPTVPVPTLVAGRPQ